MNKHCGSSGGEITFRNRTHTGTIATEPQSAWRANRRTLRYQKRYQICPSSPSHHLVKVGHARLQDLPHDLVWQRRPRAPLQAPHHDLHDARSYGLVVPLLGLFELAPDERVHNFSRGLGGLNRALLCVARVN